MPLGTEVGLGLHDIVLDGDPALPPIKGHSPQFSASVRRGQTAGWTKMTLGMEVGLGPGNFVFDGDPATPRKKDTPPHLIFGPCLLWPNGWVCVDEDPGTEVDLSPGHIQPPSFRPMSIVATVAHLSYCCELLSPLSVFKRLF